MPRQPGARVFTIGAPFGAVHHDAAVGQRCRLGCGRLRAVAHGGVYLADGAAQFIVVWLRGDVVHIDVTDDALFIQDEDGAFGVAFLPQHAELLRHRAVRPKIRKQRVGDAAKVFGPGGEAGDGIHADTQNLGVQSRETGHFGFVKRDLLRSYGRESQREKSEHHILAAVIAERDICSQLRGQGEIRCGGAGFKCHLVYLQWADFTIDWRAT